MPSIPPRRRLLAVIFLWGATNLRISFFYLFADLYGGVNAYFITYRRRSDRHHHTLIMND